MLKSRVYCHEEKCWGENVVLGNSVQFLCEINRVKVLKCDVRALILPHSIFMIDSTIHFIYKCIHPYIFLTFIRCSFSLKYSGHDVERFHYKACINNRPTCTYICVCVSELYVSLATSFISLWHCFKKKNPVNLCWIG